MRYSDVLLRAAECETFHLAQGCENKNVIIIGAGTIGLLAIQCAVALGAKSVTARCV